VTRLCVVYDVCWNSYSEMFSLRVVVLVAVSVNDSGKCVALTENCWRRNGEVL